VAVPGGALADHLPVQDVQRREEIDAPVALVIVGHGLRLAALERQPGLGPIEAWIMVFASMQSTTAWSGGFMYRPTTSVSFSRNGGPWRP
jgi:hypothetical protein